IADARQTPAGRLEAENAAEVFVETCNDVEQSCLAAAGRAGDDAEFARCNARFQVAERNDRPAPRVTFLRNVNGNSDSHRRHLVSRRSNGCRMPHSIASTTATKASEYAISRFTSNSWKNTWIAYPIPSGRPSSSTTSTIFQISASPVREAITKKGDS